MNDRELTQQALWALKDLIAAYPETACIETRISAQKVIAAFEAELAKPEQPDLRKAVEMAVPLLIGYREYSGDHRIANRCGEVLEALRQALAQPEFDTPESHIVKWSIPVDPNNFGEALAQPQQDKLLVDLIQEQRAEIDRLRQTLAQPEHPLDKKADNARELGLDYEPNVFTKQQNVNTSEERVHKSDKYVHEPVAWMMPDHGFDRTGSHMAGEYVDTAGTEHQFKYVAYGLRADENGKLSIGELPKRKWVGLMDDDIQNVWDGTKGAVCLDHKIFARLIEAKLKEKNE